MLLYIINWIVVNPIIPTVFKYVFFMLKDFDLVYTFTFYEKSGKHISTQSNPYFLLLKQMSVEYVKLYKRYTTNN